MSKHLITTAIFCALVAGLAPTVAAQQGPVPTQPPPGWQWHPQAGWVWVGTPGQPPSPQQPAPPQPQPPAAQPHPPAAQPPAAQPQPGYATQPQAPLWAPAAQPPAAAPQWAPTPQPAAAAPQAPAEEPSAQEPDDWSARVRAAAMRPSLTVQGYSGAGSESEVRYGSNIYTSDKELAPGAALTFVVPLIPHVAVGALTGVRSWTDGWTQSRGRGNHLMWDIDVLAQLRLPFSATGSQVYLNVPFGLSLNFMDEEGLRWDEDFTTNVGFNVGFTAGVRVMFGRVFGLMAEMGYAHHAPSVHYENQDGEVDVDWSFNELSSNIGLVFAF